MEYKIDEKKIDYALKLYIRRYGNITKEGFLIKIEDWINKYERSYSINLKSKEDFYSELYKAHKQSDEYLSNGIYNLSDAEGINISNILKNELENNIFIPTNILYNLEIIGNYYSHL